MRPVSQVDPLSLAKSAMPADTLAQIAEGLKHGLSLRQACDFAGAAYATVKAWMVVSENDPLPVVEFRRLLRQAMAEVAYNDLRAISAATQSDWKAAAWRLSRLFKKRWAEEKISVDRTQITMHANQTVVAGAVTENPWSAVLNVSPQPSTLAIDAGAGEPCPDDADPFAC